ncbi:MAG: hypothetical protein JWO94_2920, partial [Verrucomicrobiaceae bacterium]|nr:hypothetical protein [Verrucomicrobiaceae bacterium]
MAAKSRNEKESGGTARKYRRIDALVEGGENPFPLNGECQQVEICQMLRCWQGSGLAGIKQRNGIRPKLVPRHRAYLLKHEPENRWWSGRLGIGGLAKNPQKGIFGQWTGG